MRPIRLVLSLAVVIGLMCGASVPATLRAAEGTGSAQYFEATGHKVEGSFLNFWQRNGGLAIFGYPIPSTFQQDGKLSISSARSFSPFLS